MDISAIQSCTQLSLAEQMTFPDVIARLSAAGAERYIADLTGKQKITYGLQGETHTGPLIFESATIPTLFDAAAIRSAIKGSQQGRIKYQTFLRHITQAGCSHYEVFISGRKVIYFGRDGSHHIEHFPTSP